MINRAHEILLNVFTGCIGFISVETITAANAEFVVKVICQIAIAGATVYSILKKKN